MASVRTTPTRIFIDSSVFFAAALSQTGGARELVQQGLRGRCVLLVSNLVLEETRRNMARKAPGALRTFEQLSQLPVLTVVASPNKTQVLRAAKVVATKDAPIVAAALRGRADYLATHDVNHLLQKATQIKESFGLGVLTPGDTLPLVRGS